MTATALQFPPAGFIETSFNYLASADRRAVTWMAPDGVGAIRREGDFVERTVAVQDARPFARDLSLDREGFSLTVHPTRVRDFYDPAEVEAVYHPEVEQLVKDATGASRVVVFDATVRVSGAAREGGREHLRAPVRNVHNDYTERSGPQRVRDLMGDEAEALLAKRFAVINVWRPIRGPLETSPLGIVDATTIDPDDRVLTDLKYENRTGEIYQYAFNEKHRWYYFPRMLRHEAVLLKCYGLRSAPGPLHRALRLRRTRPRRPTPRRARASRRARSPSSTSER